MKPVFVINRFPLFAGLLFVMTLVLTLTTAWAEGLCTYRLDLSFSSYVALRPWTVVLYFGVAVAMLTLLIAYVIELKLPLIKKIVYAVVFLGVFGTAVFPYNAGWSETAAALHDQFAIMLMLSTTLSFVLSVIFASSGKQRIFAGFSILYAGVFIAAYFGGALLLFRTFFIWEVLFIFLLLTGLLLEHSPQTAPTPTTESL